MDCPTLKLTSSKDVGDVRLCDTRETLVVPASASGEGQLFIPYVAPFDEDLRQRLLTWGGDVATHELGALISYRLPDQTALERELGLLEDEAALPDGSAVELPASFSGRLAFLGYEWLQRDSGSLQLLTYWRVMEPPSSRLKIFVHLLDETGNRVAQHDGLGSPPQGWVPGDLVVQKHVLPLSSDLPGGLYVLQLGLYNAATGARLSVTDADRILLPPLAVEGER
jgi:hypothetical protein